MVLKLEPVFDEEFAFYELLSEILKQSLLGQPLSDSSRHLFSTEHPFPLDEDLEEKESNFIDNETISGSESLRHEIRSASEEESKFH